MPRRFPGGALLFISQSCIPACPRSGNIPCRPRIARRGLAVFFRDAFSQNDYRRGYQNRRSRDDQDELFLLRRAELGASPILLHNGSSFLHGFVMLSSMEILIIQAKAELKAASGNCEHFLNITGQKRKMRQTARCAACARKEKRV